MILWGSGWMSTEQAQKNGYNSWQRFWNNVKYAVTFKWLKKKKEK